MTGIIRRILPRSEFVAFLSPAHIFLQAGIQQSLARFLFEVGSIAHIIFFGRSLTQQGIFYVFSLHFVQCRRSMNKVCSCLGIRRGKFDKFHGIQELRSRLHETHRPERGGGRGQELRLRIEEKTRSKTLQFRSFLNWRIMLTEKNIYISIFSIWRGLSGQVEIKFFFERMQTFI